MRQLLDVNRIDCRENYLFCASRFIAIDLPGAGEGLRAEEPLTRIQGQIGRNATRSVHSSAFVAVQIRNQVVCDLSNGKMLRNDEKPRTALCPHELPEVSRHGRLIVPHEDAAIARCTGNCLPGRLGWPSSLPWQF